MRCVLFAIGLSLAVSACDRPPSADGLSQWSPQDHDRTEESAKLAGGQQAAPQAANPETQNRQLVEMTWRNQCAVCHGVLGKGDGPNGPMVKASDLSQEAWQTKVTDEEIAGVIKTGKGKMPKFDLPDPVVLGLVSRIRAVRGR